MGDYGGHVVVAVFGEAATECDAGLGIGKLAVASVEGLVAGVVYGVERFHAWAPFGGVFARDDCVRIAVYFVAEDLEVFVFDNAGEGDGS